LRWEVNGKNGAMKQVLVKILLWQESAVAAGRFTCDWYRVLQT